MAYLFDTDAISEVLKPKPLAEYVRWLETIPRADQFTSGVVVGELFKGAYRSRTLRGTSGTSSPGSFRPSL